MAIRRIDVVRPAEDRLSSAILAGLAGLLALGLIAVLVATGV